jgi:hypothetical protein
MIYMWAVLLAHPSASSLDHIGAEGLPSLARCSACQEAAPVPSQSNGILLLPSSVLTAPTAIF